MHDPHANLVTHQLQLDRARHQQQRPQEMVYYWCPGCEIDNCRTDRDRPFCYGCGSYDGLTELRREPLTKAAMLERMQRCAKRVMQQLQTAYAEDSHTAAEEARLLQALANGQDLQTELQRLAQENSPRP